MFSLRASLVLVALVISGMALPIERRQDQEQGQPISVGLTANRSAPAVDVFGTTTDAVNFLTLPTGLCIVPEYKDQAGIGKAHELLTVQLALEICPRAKRVVVSTSS